MNAQTKVAINVQKYVSAYIKLRDKKKEIQDRHKEELAPINAMMEKLEGVFMNHLTAIGSDSCSVNGVGTVYRTTDTSATLADADAFRRHVIGTEAWDLIDWKANKTATRDFIEENGTPPPGVNFTMRDKIGVRRK